MRRIAKLEPFLEGARQVIDVAILVGRVLPPCRRPQQQRRRWRRADAAGAEAALRRHRSERDVQASYKLIILPDEIRSTASSRARLKRYCAGGGKLLLTGIIGGLKAADGSFAVDAGIRPGGPGGLQPVLHPRRPKLDAR